MSLDNKLGPTQFLNLDLQNVPVIDGAQALVIGPCGYHIARL
jgi:hypothetical protein